MDDYKFRILLSLIRSVAFKAQCYEVLGIIERLTREPNATAPDTPLSRRVICRADHPLLAAL